jgi:hypothetical protein
MAHTPGPWKALMLFADGKVIRRDAWQIWTPGYDVATYVPGAAPIRKEADARLIAAAPELLEACEAFVETFPIYGWDNDTSLAHKRDELWPKFRAALAKARGES